MKDQVLLGMLIVLSALIGFYTNVGWLGYLILPSVVILVIVVDKVLISWGL